MKIKLPITKELTHELGISILCIAGIHVFRSYRQHEGFPPGALVSAIPALLLLWVSIDKRFILKDGKKARKRERMITFPFSSFALTMTIYCATAGIAVAAMLWGRDNSALLILITVSIAVLIAAVICHEHPRIGLNDSWNVEDDIERLKIIPKEELPAYQDGVFTYTGDGFTINSGDTSRSVKWEEIDRIQAYKIDQMTVDKIVIEVFIDGNVLIMHDETPGHMKFMENAGKKLGFDMSWFMKVAFPAFETNLTEIYNKDIHKH